MLTYVKHLSYIKLIVNTVHPKVDFWYVSDNLKKKKEMFWWVLRTQIGIAALETPLETIPLDFLKVGIMAE